MRSFRTRPLGAGAIALCMSFVCGGTGFAQEPAPAFPPSLKTIPVPLPDLTPYVADFDKLKVLGKLLFWDQQVGSDGMACATCHYHAGVDNRTRNQTNPGPGDVFDAFATGGSGPNYTPNAGDFPTRQLLDPLDNESMVVHDLDDRHANGGVFNRVFTSLSGTGMDNGVVFDDQDGFQVGGILALGGRNLRRAEPRNAPTIFNVIFFHRVFFDGRANHCFNGRNTDGDQDPTPHLFVNNGGVLEPTNVSLKNFSVGSQAVGPPTSDREMSFAGRDWDDIGVKMLPLKPLVDQEIHEDDSVLGTPGANLSNSPGNGLNTADCYEDLVKCAFKPELWNSATPVDGIRQIEKNFSFFFGVAIGFWESTLIADDCRYDQWADDGFPEDGGGILTAQELEGLDIFMNRGACSACHSGSEFGGAAISQLGEVGPEGEVEGLLERMLMADGCTDGDFRMQTEEAPEPPEPEEGEEPEPMGEMEEMEEFEDVPILGFDPRGMLIEIRDAWGKNIAWGLIAGAGSPPMCMDVDTCTAMNPGTWAPVDSDFEAEIRFRLDAQCNMRLRVSMGWCHPGLPGGTYTVAIGGKIFGEIEMAQVGGPAVYDNGFYNIGVRLTDEDPGVFGLGGFGPHSLALRAKAGENVDGGALQPPVGVDERVVGNGAQRAVSVRGSELTGPFFRHGGFSTLEQVIFFYTGGGHFIVENTADADPEVDGIGGMDAERIAALAAFIRTLTDERVRFERGPFDHPSISLPEGHPMGAPDSGNGEAVTLFTEIPASGINGLPGPLLPFHTKLAPAVVCASSFMGDPILVNEAGDAEASRFNLSLAKPPTEDVTIQLVPSLPGQLRLADTTNMAHDLEFVPQFESNLALTFTTQDWFWPRWITVEAVEDMQVDASPNMAIWTTVSGTDPEFGGLVVDDIQVTAIDSGLHWDTFEFEAEDGVMTGPMQTVYDTTASNLRCVNVANGNGNQHDPAQPGGGIASYTFTVSADPFANDFVVWALEQAPTRRDDSFWVQMDNGPWVRWRLYSRPGMTWFWDQVNDTQSGAGQVFNLSPGEHTLRIQHAEDGAAVDKLIITNQAGFKPEGYVPEAPVRRLTPRGSNRSVSPLSRR